MKKFKRILSLTMAAVLCLSCMASPALALETAGTTPGELVQEPAGEESSSPDTPESTAAGEEPSAADAFVAAVDALDRDAILAAANAWGLANQAWQADSENEALNAALEQAVAAQDEATAPLFAAEDLYYDLSEEEQQQRPVADAYAALMALYAAMTVCMDNPTASDTETDPPEDALAVLYGDLPDAPTGSYMGSMGLPIATGETKISISEWRDDLFAAHSAYFDADALNADDLTLTVGKQANEDYALVPILVQVEYPANGGRAFVTLPDNVEVISFASDESLKAANDTERSKVLNYSYTETSASVSGFYAKAAADFDAVLTYSAPDGTALTKTLHVSIKDDAALVPTLFSARSAAAYAERPTPSVTSGKITKVEKVADTWLIWFNGEPAYCCSHGKNGQPTGCPTYSYAYTSTVDADQFIPGDHYGNQIRIWGGLGQLSLGLLAERHTDAAAAAAYAARTATTYSAVDAAVLEYAYSIYDEGQLYVIENYPQSQAARLYLDGARAAMGQPAGHATTYDGSGYYTYIYDSGNPNWQIVAVEGPPIGEEEEPEPTPTPTYDANWNVDITESASASFEASMTVKVDKYANVTHEALSDAGITVQGSPANGDLDGGSWQVDPASQIIRTDNGDGSVTFTYKGSVTKSASRSDSGSVTGQSSQEAADSEAARQRAEAENRLRGEAQADAQAQANAAAQAAAEAARKFLVQETGVPHGYDPTDSSSQTLTVQPNGEATAAIANQPWRASVRWEKLDAITGGRLTEDTQFTLYEWSEKEEGYRVSLNYRVVRLADGTYTVCVTNPDYTDWAEGFVYYTQDNLGRFKIEEKTAAYGYTQQFAQRKVWSVPMSLFADSDDHLSDGPWSVEFEITGQDQEIAYLGEQADRNQPWGNKVIIRKTDSETGNAIKADAQFSLYEWNAERGLYEISPDYTIVRDADGSYTVQCLHKEWTLAEYGSLYYEDTLCDMREDTANHDGTVSKHNVYYQDCNLAGYSNSRAYTNDGQYLIVEHLAPSGYYGDWTDTANPGAAGSDLGKRAYYLRLTGDGSTILLDNAAYNADILTENKGGILVETTDGIVTVEISATVKPAGRSYATDASGLAANEDVYTMTPKAGAFQNDHVWGELVLTKQDLDQAGGTAQHGDASMEGAVYDLYAAEDIQHPDGVSGVVDYSKITDANGTPLHHTTVLTNGGWDSDFLPLLKKDHLVASAAIQNGKLAFANLYLGRYYLVERATGLVLPLDSDGQYYISGQYPVLNSKLELTGKYMALAQSGGEYTDYVYRNQYSAVAVGRALDGSKTYDGYYLSYATGYLCDEVNHYETLAYGGESQYITRSEESSPDAVLKSGFEIRKLVSTTGQPSPALKLQGAGFTVYRVSALSKVSEFTLNPDGSYNAQSILDAYRKDAYDNETAKYDFSGEGQAVATMYESDAATVESYNHTLTPDGDNANGSGKGWVPTDKPNNYRLAEIFTNEEGTLRVQGLPYGQYLVVETTVPQDVFQCDPFVVAVDSSAPQSTMCQPNGSVTTASNSYMTYNVLDEELEGYLQLVKVDAETGKAVKIANTAFSIYALHENGEETLVEMTDPASGSAWAKTSVFYTDANGELKTPEKLPLGRYRIVEVEGPEGFFNDEQYNVVFELTSKRVWQVVGNATDDMDDYILTEEYSNHETLGQLTIRKEGDVLTGYEDGRFIYEKDALVGAVYEIRAKGDVATGDRQGALWYADGDLVVTVTTGEDGQIDKTEFAPTRTTATHNFLAVSHDGTKGEVTITLPLGTYEIQEIKAPYGFTLTDTVYEVTLEWENQENDIVLAKTITVDGSTQEYGITNAKDATDEEMESRKLVFTNERVIPVPDKPGRIGVGIHKQDGETMVGLAGAWYDLYTVDAIYDRDGSKLAEAGALLGSTGPTGASGFAWFPVDIPIQGQQYANGVTEPENGGWSAAYNSGNYRIVETTAPKGYLLDSTPVEAIFTYSGQMVSYQVVSGTNSNTPTSIKVSKRDLTNGEELPGATLTITDTDGGVVKEWVSGETPRTIRGLELDKEYTLTETKPASGYALAENIAFRLGQRVDKAGVPLQETEVYIKDADGNWQLLDEAILIMEDDITKVEISKTDIVTGEELPGAELVIRDERGKEIERWISTEEPHLIEKLPAGKYTLEERTAPAGYTVAEEVPFEVLPTGEVQSVVMKDAPALSIRKTDVGGKDLPGATLVIRNLVGGEIDRWVTDGSAHEVPVTGWEETLQGGLLLSTVEAEHIYELYETVAPDGYELAERIYFKVERTTDGTLLVYTRPDRDAEWTPVNGSTLTMVDAAKPGPSPTPAPTPEPTPEATPAPVSPSFPQTGDRWPMGLLFGMAGLSLALLALLAYLRRRGEPGDDVSPAEDPQYEPTGLDEE